MVSGRVSSLALLLILLITMEVARREFKRTGRLHIRRIAGLDAIDELIGRVTEMGRPMAFIFGGGELEAQTFASLRVLDYVSNHVAKYEARMLVVTPLPEVYPMCTEVVRAAYLAQGKIDKFNPDRVMYIPGDASKPAVLGLYQREKVAGALLFGNYYYESMLYAEAASLAGASQIAGTANYHQLPFFVASCDYTLIGEEIFAAGTYLSKEPSEVAGLTAQELGKGLSVLFMLLGAILASFGSDCVSLLLTK